MAGATTDKTQFLRRFTERIQSLTKSQDIITDSNWRGGHISDLAMLQVTRIVPVIDGQISVTGGDVELTPNGSLYVGLALHELCTNAISFAALSLANSTIEINTRIVSKKGKNPPLLP